MDNQNNHYLEDHSGRCDRESKCKYHLSPKGNNPITTNSYREQPEHPTFHNENVIQTYGNSYNNNHFIHFLAQYFTEDELIDVIKRYCISTSTYWKGATIFWQIDEKLNIHAGKVMLYNISTGKRIKKPFPHINWMHNVLQMKDFVLQQCLFGLHNLEDHPVEKAICIVESEKTAIIMSIYYPNNLWLATGSKSNFKLELLKPLKQYNILAFPDKTEYENWNSKTQQLNKYGFNIKCSTYIENLNVKEGVDLVDLVID
ncbi:DUF6371 domain-containing protein [Neptunitalea lumnitzerae]|uniref:DUF6371 domain-containing protein n=1 Tax=Neptunitalea lumnitzerae TaxID=2965509 RepID=UPI00248F9D37|nr:DUF6371 domain-containing protein [Neptunitalea sp. Y10]